ncbi:MAG: septum formation initiator family protein [Candidatus Dormibacteria bacterium]
MIARQAVPGPGEAAILGPAAHPLYVTSRAAVIRTSSSPGAHLRAPSTRRVSAALVAALSGWVGFAVYGEAASGHALDRRVQVLQSQNSLLSAQIAERRHELAAANDPGWLQEEARKLGYVLPGEHVYVITSPGAGLPASGGVAVPQLPVYSPTPEASPPATPSPTAASVAETTPAPGPASPSPYRFSMPTPGR